MREGPDPHPDLVFPGRLDQDPDSVFFHGTYFITSVSWRYILDPVKSSWIRNHIIKNSVCSRSNYLLINTQHDNLNTIITIS